MIQETLKLIKKQIGLDLELCDYFTGLRTYNHRKYFNIVLNQKTCESKDFELLSRFADKYKLIRIEPNGLRRVAIYPINNENN